MKRKSSKRRAATDDTEADHVNHGTEPRSKTESEIQSPGAANETHDTNGFPPLATSVGSLPEAVQLAIGLGLDENCLFNLARALLAFEATVKLKLSREEREQAFQLWWGRAKPLLPPEAVEDEYRFIFYDAVKNAKSPLGANPLHEAISRADTKEAPAEASRYPTSARLRRLVAVCYHLQVLQGPADIFLGYRDAAKILGEESLWKAGKLLDGLVQDGVLTLVSKGTPGGRRASRFRFNFVRQPDAPTS
jgi:hypothetical protein